MTEHRKVLVTGAAGFVGNHLLRELQRGGLEIRATDLRPPALSGPGVETITGDLRDSDVLRAATRGCEGVIHLAGRVHVRREPADAERLHHEANVTTTRHLLEQAARAGTRVFVYMSSIAAVCNRSDVPVDDGTPPEPVGPYGRSKLAAETAVHEHGRALGVTTVCLRPPMAYGPRMPGNPLRLFRLVSSGMPLPLGSVTARRTFIYVGNLVAAARLALDTAALAGGNFCVSDEQSLTSAGLAERIGDAIGRPARIVPCPLVILRAVGRFGDAISTVRAFPITTRAVDSLTTPLEVDSHRFWAAAGARPPWTVEEGLRDTAEWFTGET
jgi:UDP-glucose 4-epimerase